MVKIYILNKKQGSFMNKKGFTLIETVIAIGVFSISILSIALIFQLTAANSADPGTRMQSVLIAESLMDEILSKSFIKPTGGFSGPFTNANRNQFDTVIDYNGLNFSGITNSAGDSLPGLENYTVNITVSNTAIGTIPNSDAYLVNINVIGPNDNFTLKGFSINQE